MPQTVLLAFQDADGSVPIVEWLEVLAQQDPKVHGKCVTLLERLAEFGNDLRRPTADILRDGIYELRASHQNVNYRILYGFVGQNVVVVSHGLTKEKRVPAKDIDLALERKNLVLEDREKYTATFEDQ